MRSVILILLLVLSGSVSMAQSGKSAKPAVASGVSAINWLSYTDSASGLMVKYPSTWRLKTTNPKTPVILHAPSEGEGDVFSENINYVIRKLSMEQKVTTADIAASVKSSLPTMLDDFVLEYEKKVQWLGSSAVELSYSGSSKGEKAGIKVKLVQRIGLTNSKMVVATYTAADGKADVSRADAIKIIDLTSFKK